MSHTSRLASVSLALALALAGCMGQPVRSATWVKVTAEKSLGLSGMALEATEAESARFIVVHDNKEPREPRLGRVTTIPGTATYRALQWPAGAEWPVDLESISAIPGQPGEFAALASAGRLFFVEVDGDRVTSARVPVDLPKPPDLEHPNYEAFRVRAVSGGLAAVWADRGDGSDSARLYWGPFDPDRGPTIAGCVIVRVPYPEPDSTRDISDIDVDESGRVWIASAWDDDNDNSTFRSAVYRIGTLTDAASPTGLTLQSSPEETARFPDHKVEALAVLGGFVLGSDDENGGGWFLLE